jgi:hypothetical protein
MRADVAIILTGMGYEVDYDFVAYAINSTDSNFTWLATSPRPTEAEINVAAVPVYKNLAIESFNTECTQRLIAAYGKVEKQVSLAMGVYGDTNRQIAIDGISSTIDATNVASDEVNAATTEEEIAAVVVNWPPLTSVFGVGHVRDTTVKVDNAQKKNSRDAAVARLPAMEAYLLIANPSIPEQRDEIRLLTETAIDDINGTIVV